MYMPETHISEKDLPAHIIFAKFHDCSFHVAQVSETNGISESSLLHSLRAPALRTEPAYRAGAHGVMCIRGTSDGCYRRVSTAG